MTAPSAAVMSSAAYRPNVTLLAFCLHRIQTARRRNARCRVDPFDDIIHLRAQSLGKHVMQHVLRKPAAIIRWRLHRFLCRNDDFELTVVNDCERTGGVVLGALHTLDGSGQNAAGFLGLQ